MPSNRSKEPPTSRGRPEAGIRRHPNAPNRWQVRYRDPSGKQRSKNFATKTEAKWFRDSIATDIRRGVFVDPHAGRRLLSDYAGIWLELWAANPDLRPSTVARDRQYITMINDGLGDRPVASIRTSDVRAWISTLGGAPTTRAKALAKLRQILDLACDDDAIRSNPASGVKPPRIEYRRSGRVLTDDELIRLLQASEAAAPTQAVLVWLMARVGLRLGEASGIRHIDLDLATSRLTVAQSLTDGVPGPLKGRRSTNEARQLPMPPDLVERIRQHLSQQPIRSLNGLLVVSPRGYPIRGRNWRKRVWNRITHAADLEEIRPHDLRHTCATRLFTHDRWTPAEVQAFLGHRDPRVTLDVYTHIEASTLPQPSTLPRPNVDKMWTPA